MSASKTNDGAQERAAVLLATGTQTDVDIAREIGVTDRQLRRWKNKADFIARVDAAKKVIADALVNRGIADRQNRVDALNDRWLRMQRLIEARADEHRAIPGGDTGLLVRQTKLANNGDTVDEYAFDVALPREMRAHEEQAAKELGQWSEKSELSGEIVTRSYIGVPVEDV